MGGIKLNNLVEKLNKVLGFKLNQAQTDYIIGDRDNFVIGERNQGFTTAHIIKLCLSEGPVINMCSDIEDYADKDGWHYAKFYYRPRFYEIRKALVEAGFTCREIRNF